MTKPLLPLPTGNADKKIEHVADYIQQVEETVTGDGRPFNFLKNAAFLSNYAGLSPYEVFSSQDKTKTLSLINGIGRAPAPNWGLEIENGKSFSVLSVFPNLIENGIDEPSNQVSYGSLTASTAGRTVLFQVFDVQHLPESGEKALHAYVRLHQSPPELKVASIKFGVGVVDGSGNITSILASKTQALDQTALVKQEFWLKIPNIDASIANETSPDLVYFVESSAGGLISITGAGVYYGKSGEVPQLAGTETGDKKQFRIAKAQQRATRHFHYPRHFLDTHRKST